VKTNYAKPSPPPGSDQCTIVGSISAPCGTATAVCNDNTYSCSHTRQGLRVQKVVASLRKFGLSTTPRRRRHLKRRILALEHAVDSILRFALCAQLEGAKDGQRAIDDEETRREIFHLQRSEIHLPRDREIGSKDRWRRRQTQTEIC
jgi:hypothetical protein